MAAGDACALLAGKLWSYMVDGSPEFATYRGFDGPEDKLDSFSLDTYKQREVIWAKLNQCRPTQFTKSD